MIRAIVLISLISLLAILPTMPSSADSFSYSFKVHGHEIVVTGLASGTYSLELDGVIHSPIAGEIEATAEYVLNAPRGGTSPVIDGPRVSKPTTEKFTVYVSNNGKQTSINGNGWFMDMSWRSWMKTSEWVNITVNPDKSKSKAALLKIDNKPVYRSPPSFDWGRYMKHPYPRAMNVYFFHYYFNDGKRIIGVDEDMRKDFGESPPPLFTEVVKTIRKREIKLPPKSSPVQPSGQH